ncbi:MAG: hypothetical protein RLZZ306_2224, partial [Bacteroidota bacterium]
MRCLRYEVLGMRYEVFSRRWYFPDLWLVSSKVIVRLFKQLSVSSQTTLFPWLVSPQAYIGVKILLLFHVLFPTTNCLLPKANAQIGTWQTHFNYFNTKDLAIVEKNIYCVSENGFFYYDTEAKQSVKLSKIDGLTETGIAKIGYNLPSKTLVIAYQTGNIDLLTVNAKGEPDKI